MTIERRDQALVHEAEQLQPFAHTKLVGLLAQAGHALGLQLTGDRQGRLRAQSAPGEALDERAQIFAMIAGADVQHVRPRRAEQGCTRSTRKLRRGGERHGGRPRATPVDPRRSICRRSHRSRLVACETARIRRAPVAQPLKATSR